MRAERIKVAGACDVTSLRRVVSPPCNGSGDLSNPDYLGADLPIQALVPGQDVVFTLTAINMPFLINKLIISVAVKGCVAVKSIKIAGREYLLNGEILADEFDPKAEDSECPINLSTCTLAINQSVIVTLFNYTPGELSFFGGVMIRGFT